MIEEEKDNYKVTGINDYVGFTIDFETGGLPIKDCISKSENAKPKINAITKMPFTKSEKWDFTNIAITEVTINCFRIKDLRLVDRLKLQVYPYYRQQKTKLRKKGEDFDESDSGEYMVYDQEALDYTNISIAELMENGEDIKDVASQIIDFMQRNILVKSAKTGRPSAKFKGILLGQNIQFDEGFFIQLLTRGEVIDKLESLMVGTEDYYGNFKPRYLDTLDLSKMIFGNDEFIDKYKLENVAERLGFTMYDAHDSMADTDATYNIYATLASMLRSGGGGVDNDAIFEQKKDRLTFKI